MYIHKIRNQVQDKHEHEKTGRRRPTTATQQAATIILNHCINELMRIQYIRKTAKHLYAKRGRNFIIHVQRYLAEPDIRDDIFTPTLSRTFTCLSTLICALLTAKFSERNRINSKRLVYIPTKITTHPDTNVHRFVDTKVQ